MRRFSLLATVAVLFACKTLSEDPDEVEYASDAQANLQLGMESFESSDYTQAGRYFDYVKAKYPYMEEAKIAELRLGDTQLASEQYIEARDRFQTFVRMHPTHPEVDYAAFKAAESYWIESPDPFFAFPPVFEKDLSGVRNAVRALEAFQRDHPSSKHKEAAQKVLDEARRRLAEHELYVAEFYEKRKQWPAVVTRLKTVVDQYPGLGFDEQALFRMHDAYKAMNDSQGASDALKQVITRFPGTPAAERATKLLGS